MKAVILAAGEGSRLRPLTAYIPKPCLKIFGKSILAHNIDNLKEHIDEFIIVVKYKKEKVQETLEKEFGNKLKISYFEQGDVIGTAGAIIGLEKIISGDFLLLNGDSIFSKSDFEKVIKSPSYSCLVKEVEDPSKYGIFKEDSSGFAEKIIEKPSEFVGNLANLGVYKFNDKIFDYIQKIELSPRGELEITDAINIFVKNFTFALFKIENDFIDVGYPWDILTANSYFLDQLTKTSIEGEVEEGVTIKGKIVLGKGSVLKSGTYIEGNVFIGENSIIGPNTYLRGNTVIGDDCKIGNAVEIKNSSIGDGTHIPHLSYLGDSIIGNNVNIAGGFISANIRHDKSNIKVMVKGKLVDTGLRKLGIIIGDNVKTGIKSYSYPGRVLDSDSFTNPGEIIK